MRLNHWMIIFISIFMGLGTIHLYNSMISSKSAQFNTDYANYLITATEGSVASVYEDMDSNSLFSTQHKREKAINVFYESLRKCFNYDASFYAERIYYYVPCVFLIDTDGYYIEYTTEYTDDSGHAAFSEIITPINKWAKIYSSGGAHSGTFYNVEYHLDNSVTVEYKNNDNQIASISGKYSAVYEKLGRPAALHALSSYDRFEAERTSFIISTLQTQMEYYINIHDESLNQFNNIQYQFTLPEIAGEDWARLIDMPTVVSFLQGVQTPSTNGYLNIYAFAGSELELQCSYFVTEESDGVKYYHRESCPLVSSNVLKEGYSMKKAAQDGAFPCPHCIR